MKVLKNYNEILTQGYNQVSHYGIDLVGNNNNVHVLDYITPIEAGVVEDLRINATGFEENGSYGNYILINHENGCKTRYAHLAYNTITVSKGDRVTKGQIIGYMGATGYAFGGHLHFEIIKDNVHIDPTNYIFGNSSIIVSNPEPDPLPDDNNTPDNNTPDNNTPVNPKLIYTCTVEDNYYLHLNVGDKLYFSKD